MSRRIFLTVLFLNVGGFSCLAVPVWALQDRLSIEEELRIGSLDGADALSIISEIAVTPTAVFVGQAIERVVKHFSLDGSLKSVIGGAGEGPGEFLRVSRVAYIDDRILVLDEQQSRLITIAADGPIEETRKLQPPPPPRNSMAQWLAPVFPAVKGRFVWVGGIPATRRQELPVRPVVLANGDGTILDTLPERHDRDRVLEISTGPVSNPYHNGTRFDVSSNGRFYAAVDPTGEGVRIQRVDLLSLERLTVNLPLRRVSVPKAALREFASRFAEVVPGTREASLSRELDQGQQIFVSDVAVLSDGTVWVARPAFDGEHRTWYRVDPTNGAVAVATLGHRMKILGGQGQELWVQDLDEFDVPYILRLRVAPPS